MLSSCLLYQGSEGMRPNLNKVGDHEIYPLDYVLGVLGRLHQKLTEMRLSG